MKRETGALAVSRETEGLAQLGSQIASLVWTKSWIYRGIQRRSVPYMSVYASVIGGVMQTI